MSSISQIVSHLPSVQPLSQSPSFTANTNHIQARSQTLTNTSISFVTADGDRVSLSSGSQVNTSLDTYTFQGLADGQTTGFHSQEFSTSIQQNFQFLVEGDLNDQEQADIQEFLKSAKSIFQDLTRGNTEEATNTATSLGNLESLAQASLFVRQATSVSLATQSSSVAFQEGSGLNEASRRNAQSEPGKLSTIEQILEKIRAAQDKFQIDPEKLVNRLPALATAVLQSIEDDTSESTDSRPSILEQIQHAFFESILKSTKDSAPQQGSEETVADRISAVSSPPLNNEQRPNATSSPEQETTQT